MDKTAWTFFPDSSRGTGILCKGTIHRKGGLGNSGTSREIKTNTGKWLPVCDRGALLDNNYPQLNNNFFLYSLFIGQQLSTIEQQFFFSTLFLLDNNYRQLTSCSHNHCRSDAVKSKIYLHFLIETLAQSNVKQYFCSENKKFSCLG